MQLVYGRLAVICSCFVFWILDISKLSPSLDYVLLAILIVFACAEKLCGMMNLVAVERDWAVVMAEGDETVLGNLNATIRRIDLACKLGGPFAIAILDGYSTRIAILANLATNALSLPVEWYAIEKVFNAIPALKEQKSSASHVPQQGGPPAEIASNKSWRKCPQATRQGWQENLASLQSYFSHRACLPSFSLTLLYFTVLSFSGQMITYLASVGWNSMHIGIARTVSVGFEISATWLGPLVMRKVGPVRSGIWFLNWQMLCLACGVAVFWVAESPHIAASALVLATIFSRVGLWGFDLSAQIIVQEVRHAALLNHVHSLTCLLCQEIEPEHRGSFSSVEASLQNAFEMCSFVATAIFYRPEQFRWPLLSSYAAVLTAAILYSAFVRSRRGHLLHLSDCIHTKRRQLPRRSEYSSLPGWYELNATGEPESIST